MNEETDEKKKSCFEDRQVDDESVCDMMEFLCIDVDLSSSSSHREETSCSVSYLY